MKSWLREIKSWFREFKSWLLIMSKLCHNYEKLSRNKGWQTRVMYRVVLVRRDDPRLKLVAILKMFCYSNNHYIVIPLCSFNQFRHINFIWYYIITYVVIFVQSLSTTLLIFAGYFRVVQYPMHLSIYVYWDGGDSNTNYLVMSQHKNM